MYGVSGSIKILVIEDDEDDYFLTTQTLRSIPGSEKWIIDWCYNYKNALQHLCERKYDLYFIDYFLGGKTGLDLLKESITQECMEPIIMLTGQGNRAIDMESMRSGATDYLIKSELNPEKLERSIRYALEKSHHLKNLRTNEQKYRSIFENSMDAIFLLDDELRLVTVNKATTGMLEYTEEELKGMYVTDLIEEFEEAEQLSKQFQALREVRDREVKLVCKGGDVKTCLLSIVTSSGYSEKEFIQGILHDITQLRIAEKSLLQMEKTALFSKLVQTLAHEIRNPLNNVSLASQQLGKEDHYEFQEQYFDMIIRNNNRINAILTQLMFSSGEQLGKHEPTTIQGIVNDAIDGARDRLTLREIELELNYPDREIPVVADKSQLSIALLNIITNAVEAMENVKGKLAIEVEVLRDFCEIRISDNGSGITEENQKRLFDPYFTTKRNGLGFGLSATLNILQSHRAKIQVNSTPGEGTSFLVSIPLFEEIQEQVSIK